MRPADILSWQTIGRSCLQQMLRVNADTEIVNVADDTDTA